MTKWGVLSRVASLLVVMLYVILAARNMGLTGDWMGFVILLGLVLIWFPERLGSATGFIGHGNVDLETPPFLVAAMGWFVLVGLPVLITVLSK